MICHHSGCTINNVPKLESGQILMKDLRLLGCMGHQWFPSQRANNARSISMFYRLDELSQRSWRTCSKYDISSWIFSSNTGRPTPNSRKTPWTNFRCSLQRGPSVPITPKYDDVTTWKHFPHYWTFVRGIQWRSPVDFTHKGLVMRRYDVSLCHPGAQFHESDFPSSFKFDGNFILFSFKFCSSDRYEILHMARQLRCRGICNIGSDMVPYNGVMPKQIVHRIWISMEKSFVK